MFGIILEKFHKILIIIIIRKIYRIRGNRKENIGQYETTYNSDKGHVSSGIIFDKLNIRREYRVITSKMQYHRSNLKSNF